MAALLAPSGNRRARSDRRPRSTSTKVHRHRCRDGHADDLHRFGQSQQELDPLERREPARDHRQSELAQTSLAEFMRLYEHYRARAIWNMPQGAGSGADGAGRQRQKAFTFKMKRDHWVKGAFKEGTPEAVARVALACPPDRWNRASIRDRPGVAARPGCS